MIISSANVGMESVGRFSSSERAITKFRVVNGSGKEAHNTSDFFDTLGNGGQREENPALTSEKNHTKEAKENAAPEDAYGKMKNSMEALRARLNTRVQVNSRENSIDTLRKYTMQFFLRLLMGDDMRKIRQSMAEDKAMSSVDEGTAEGYQGGNEANAPGNVFTLTLTNKFYYTETQSASFGAKGQVTTADGRQIDFNVDLMMSRSFSACYEEQIRSVNVNMCDPLVLNLEGNPAGLTDQKFYFDLDSDGEKEELAALSAGSGYLALDRNGNGEIDNGSELFGPGSGDGFEDLAQYDEDGNGWIDEADSVWSKLKVWCSDGSGEMKLYSLADKGVGAISLQHARTDFNLTDETNRVKGAVRSTGVFLYENGNVGTMQQLDLAQ